MAGDANMTSGERWRPRRGLFAQFATEILATFLAISLGLLAAVLIDYQMEKSGLAKTSSEPVAKAQTAEACAARGTLGWAANVKAGR